MNYVSEKHSLLKKEYMCHVKNDSYDFNVKLILNEVINTWYLDIIVEGKRKVEYIKYLEIVQDKILTSGIRDRYIDVLSYDAISEYYCNKISPKLNELERNLRKLLFNVYIVNFGVKYFNTTIIDEIEKNIKQRISSNSTKEKKLVSKICII